MVVALGMLDWPPEVFWRATPHEMWAAVDGRHELNADHDKPAAPDDETIADLVARFPDENPDPDLL